MVDLNITPSDNKSNSLTCADDLLIFSKGTKDSILSIVEGLTLFHAISGLQLNPAKTELYCAGMASSLVEELKELTHFTIGNFPFRNLGIPLTSRKLKAADCDRLVDSITARIKSWTTKYLSFAGRVQLIKSVLFSMHNFWCQHFLLPQKVIKLVTTACAYFLWKGDVQVRYNARVAWHHLCQPKSAGGLGLKDIATWNKACILKHLWLLLIKAGSLWVAWADSYMLKGTDLWSAPVKGNASWCWRKLMSFREVAKPIFTSIAGPYSTTKVWRKLKTSAPKSPWERLIWFPFRIPRQALIAWMAILERLPTGDRMLAWGYGGNVDCIFCGQHLESRNHIFFECGFSQDVWAAISTKLDICMLPLDWSGVMQWMLANARRRSLFPILIRQCWAAAIYHLWRERNQRRHGNRPMSPESIVQLIFNDIYLKFLSMRHNGL